MAAAAPVTPSTSKTKAKGKFKAAAAPAAAAPADLSNLNAKQRRLLKRASERGETPPAAAAAAAGAPVPAGVDISALNAKQRRLLKRAQERGEAPPPAVAAASKPAGAGISTKKRKRAGDGDDDEGEGAKERGVPHVVFVGQLGFKTTAEQLRAHLEEGGVTGGVQVRLLTDKKTGKSKGQAFVTLADAERQFKCLALHHTKLDSRVINVERSCGGKNADKRKERISSLRWVGAGHIQFG